MKDFATELTIELDKYSSRLNRAQVCQEVFFIMKDKGFDICTISDRAFQQVDKSKGMPVGPTYFMRRNNRLDCWEPIRL